ncbi:hypothetical protein SAMN06265360_11151 [Haloechinothrix alba]|uniref:Uncharacterized protein n=1 Tax=Haloechinothrix alba TaxID=664784 RepID=A0A238XJZ7_9PSEU|nr:hypothetical protein SAMN06265360_11151 [Haloechinothrix alba]
MLYTVLLCVAVTLNAVSLGALFHLGATERDGGVRARRRARTRQLESLGSVHGQAQGSVLELDRVAYREVPRYELIELLGRQGWRYVDEHLDANVWRLRFRRAGPAEAAVAVDARTRLRDELAAARPGVNGTYWLDVNDYINVPTEEIGAYVHAAGWQVCGTAFDSPRNGMIIKPAGVAAVRPSDGAFVDAHGPGSGSTLAGSGDAGGFEELRSYRRVADRAAELHRRLGFDPLDETNLLRVRARYLAWQKRIKILANVAAVFFLVVVTPPLAWLLYGHFDESLHIAFAVSGVAAVPCLTSLIWCLILVKRRNDELGPAMRAYRELRNMASDHAQLASWFRVE